MKVFFAIFISLLGLLLFTYCTREELKSEQRFDIASTFVQNLSESPNTNSYRIHNTCQGNVEKALTQSNVMIYGLEYKNAEKLAATLFQNSDKNSKHFALVFFDLASLKKTAKQLEIEEKDLTEELITNWKKEKSQIIFMIDLQHEFQKDIEHLMQQDVKILLYTGKKPYKKTLGFHQEQLIAEEKSVRE